MAAKKITIQSVIDRRYFLGLSQRSLAEIMGCSATTISQFETGGRAASGELFEEILIVLGLKDIDTSTFRGWLIDAMAKASFEFDQFPEDIADESGNTLSDLVGFIIKYDYDELEGEWIAVIEKLLKQKFKPSSPEKGEKFVDTFTQFNPYNKESCPKVAGIYVLYDKSNRPVYIGQSNNIRTRISQHMEKKWFLPPIIESAGYIKITDEDIRKFVESCLIKTCRSLLLINKKDMTIENE